MGDGEIKLPIGQRISLSGHFDEPVVLEDVRALGSGYECRVRLPDGSLDEAVISTEEAASIAGAGHVVETKFLSWSNPIPNQEESADEHGEIQKLSASICVHLRLLLE